MKRDWCHVGGLAKTILLSLLIMLVGCGRADRDHGTSAQTEPPRIVEAYFAAANAHDLEWIRGFFSETSEWSILGQTLQGLREILPPHRQDISLETYLSVQVDSTRADTVWVSVMEQNKFITAFGLESLAHSLRIVTRDSMIQRMGPAEEDSEDPFGGSLAPFFRWISEERPEAWRSLVDSTGRAIYSYENGMLLLELAQEWQQMNRGG